MAGDHDFDVALSAAEEDRGYVDQVADALRERRVRVFPAADSQAQLWGRDMVVDLDAVYRYRSRYVVVFVSQAYLCEQWTRHELRSALARAIREKREYVLPARFDDSDVPGLSPTIHSLDCRTLTPRELAAVIVSKLDEESTTGPAMGTARPAPPEDWTKRAVVDHEELFGIDESLDRLRTYLANPDGDWLISIFGAGGAGKTTLAYELVKRHAQSIGFRRIAWVSAKSNRLDQRARLYQEARSTRLWRELVTELADQLGLEVEPVATEVMAQFARAVGALDPDERCLIVIDNLESVEDAERAIEYIERERIVRPHKVILTTRESARRYSGHVREVRWDRLTDDAARQFATYLAHDEPELSFRRADLDHVAAASEGVPLLIRLIMRLAIFERLPVGSVSERLRRRTGELGGVLAQYLYADSLTALQARVGSAAAVRLMNVFCYRVSGEAFERDDFHRLSRIVDRREFDTALAAACNLSLIRTFDGNRQFTVHALLREFLCADDEPGDDP